MRSLFLAVFLLSFSLPGHTETISLAEALRTGFDNNPGFVAVKARTEAARASAEEAASRRLPRLTLSENFLWTNEPGNSLFISLNQERLELSSTADAYNDPPDRADFETRLQLTQPLYDPDIGFGSQRAEKLAEAAAAGQSSRRETLALEIFQAYLDVQAGRAALRWVQSSLEEADELHRIAGEREAAGVGLKAETLNARVRMAESRRLQIVAENRVQLARRNLALQIGSEADELDINRVIDIDMLPPPMPGQELARSDLEALKLEKDAAVLARKQSRAAWYPRAQAAASWATHDRDYPFSDQADSWTVQAGLTWLIYDGSSRASAEARARAEVRSKDALYREATRETYYAIEEARLQMETAQQELETLRIGLVAAEESYRLLLDRYRNGLAPLSEVLTAQAALEKNRADLVGAEVRLIGNSARQHYLHGTLVQAILDEKG